MIIGIGCDVIEIDRVRKAVSREAFKRRVFTEGEIAYCESRGKQSASSSAARFAAKESALKALGTGLRGGELLELEVVVDGLGKPALLLHGYHKELAQRLGVQRCNLSMSHGHDVAMAYIVMEDGK